MTYRYPGGLVRKTAANTSITGASGVWDLGSQAQAVKTNTWPISGLANPVSGSLRFRGGSVNAFLSRTPASSSNRRTWTWSGWIKLGSKFSDGYFPIFGADATGYPCSGIALTNFNIQYFSYTHPAYDWQKISTAVFRDPSAWYHIVAVSDTTNGTAEDRAIVYVNGQRITSWSTNNNPSSSFEGYVNSSSYITKVGRIAGFDYFDGYMAEVNFIDGLVLTPSSFGQTSPITGVWEPIKYTGTYGTNGFYLSLSDTSSIGKDFSGNGNNLTPNNISTANDSTFDLMRDVPTQYTPQGVTDVGGVVRGNYATLNPLDKLGSSGFPTLANGNLRATPVNTVAASTIALPTTGKWYWEATLSTGQYPEYGLARTTSPGGGSSTAVFGVYYNGTNVWLANSSDGITDGNHAINSGDIGLVAVDVDNNKVWFGRSRSGTVVWAGGGNPATGSSPTFSASGGGGVYATTFDAQIWCFPFVASGAGSDVWNANFGQQPFVYTPPSGYKTLCTTNLPTPTIGATVATAANKNFDATLYTGNGTGLGSTQTITNGGFQPDFIWIKSRSTADYHNLNDTVRGIVGTGSPNLFTNRTDAETTFTGYGVSAVNSNGFNLIGNGSYTNASGTTYVGWQWNAGGSTVTNTTGTISSQVRANPTAGFSIVTYSGNGTGGATIGHGLGVAPSMMIFKPRNATGSWLVWHTGYNSNQAQMLLDSTAAIYNPGNGLYFNSTYPSSTVATLGTSSSVNDATYTYVAYMFAPVAGFSAFGSYTGNGSTGGPFVFTGFRPRFLIVKRTNDIGSWIMTDSARSTYNVTGELFNANISGAEFTTGDIKFDYLSNGFKLREVNGAINASGSTYIYMAFAETPFKNALAR